MGLHAGNVAFERVGELIVQTSLVTGGVELQLTWSTFRTQASTKHIRLKVTNKTLNLS